MSGPLAQRIASRFLRAKQAASGQEKEEASWPVGFDAAISTVLGGEYSAPDIMKQAADYKKYVERKKREGEKPLDEKAWRTWMEGKKEEKPEAEEKPKAKEEPEAEGKPKAEAASPEQAERLIKDWNAPMDDISQPLHEVLLSPAETRVKYEGIVEHGPDEHKETAKKVVELSRDAEKLQDEERDLLETKDKDKIRAHRVKILKVWDELFDARESIKSVT